MPIRFVLKENYSRGSSVCYTAVRKGLKDSPRRRKRHKTQAGHIKTITFKDDKKQEKVTWLNLMNADCKHL